MAGKTQIRSPQVEDGGITRADLNVAEVGKAVLAKIIQGLGISITATGADAGTGDATITADGLIKSVVPKSANFSVVAGDRGKLYDVTTSTSTIAITVPAALDGFYILLRKADSAAGTMITSAAVSPSGLLALMGYGDIALVYSDGVNYYGVILPASITGASGASAAADVIYLY